MIFRNCQINIPLTSAKIGAWKFDGNAIGHERNCDTNTLDYQEFLDVWSSYIQGGNTLGASGIAVWAFELTPNNSPYGITANINGTPAVKVIEAFFKEN